MTGEGLSAGRKAVGRRASQSPPRDRISTAASVAVARTSEAQPAKKKKKKKKTNAKVPELALAARFERVKGGFVGGWVRRARRWKTGSALGLTRSFQSA